MPFRRLPILLLTAALLASIALAATPERAWAQHTVSRIVASVNDDAITDYDLNARALLIALTSNTPPTPENRQRLARQALQNLIDDRLKIQEAKRLGIDASDQEVSASIQTIERNNRMPPGGLFAALDRANVPVATLIDQVKADLMWQKVLRRRVLPQVRVATEEVDDAIARIRAAGGGGVARVSEIFLPVETPGQRGDALELAARIKEQATDSAAFANLAAQYSRAATAAVGGDLGEVQPGQLDPKLEEALGALQPGETSEPIETESGVYLMHLTARQTPAGAGSGGEVVSLARAFLPAEPGVDIATIGDRLKRTLAGIDGCDAFERAAQNLGPEQPPRVQDTRAADLPPDIAAPVAALQPGEQTEPIAIGTGMAVLMLCRRSTAADNVPSAVQVAEAIQNQRAQRRAERYLRDLRRLAFIEIRG